MKKLIFYFVFLSSPLLAQTRFYVVPDLADEVVNCVAIAKNQDKYLGIEGGVAWLRSDTLLKISLPSPNPSFKYLNISALALTDTCIWAGSYTNFLVKITPNGKQEYFDFGDFGQSLITSIAVDEQQRVWAASASQGLFMLDRQGRKMLFDQKNTGLLDNQIFKILLDKNQKLWIGTAKGLCSLDKNGKWEKYNLLKGQITALSQSEQGIWAVCVTDKDSELWQYENHRTWVNHVLPKHLAQSRIMDLAFDQKKRLWAVADRVACFHQDDWFFFDEGFISKSALCVAADQDNEIWVGTEGKGLLTTAVFPKKLPQREEKTIKSLDELKDLGLEDNIFEQKIPLRIKFEQGNAKITPSSESELKILGEILQANPLFKLRIEGHTDNVGNAALNVLLSQERAEAVKNFLMQKWGISSQRIFCVGYGGEKPIADNRFEETRSKNRRVEIVFIR